MPRSRCAMVISYGKAVCYNGSAVSLIHVADGEITQMNCWIRVSTTAWLLACGLAVSIAVTPAYVSAQQNTVTKPRARDLGVPFEGTPGPLNAITDVAGVTVGETTLISGEGKLVVGKGPIRTGVTAILPRGKDSMNNPVFAGWFSQNGNGEMTGTTWVEESGFLE